MNRLKYCPRPAIPTALPRQRRAGVSPAPNAQRLQRRARSAPGRRDACLALIWFVVALLAPSIAFSQPIFLNEVQVSHQTPLTHENGDTPDWIELFNLGPATVDLNGWGLSDSTNALFKWSFTNASLAPGSFMLVFASGKDRQPGQFGAV